MPLTSVLVSATLRLSEFVPDNLSYYYHHCYCVINYIIFYCCYYYFFTINDPNLLNSVPFICKLFFLASMLPVIVLQDAVVLQICAE